ncbi:oxidoreductase [Niallia circulans]|uniref:Gfo/Idh/MocA family protein n=1 Tax=Niallia circulans TaxID=1397 RepID=UPI00077C9446|nr:Gfo/Idh/MocA family oxidoreductase [Niallia circulans]MDR4316590.1 Gfo/Idh/MocA family oxidoreductase [Niallia circulans]MED3838233.1 Gfo/Idh/MocA family oxidoreductase [Niallia circulans]MED4243708.1 Gfo/Idh/MocA family oxidoreductase [Niallia circulans]MED4246100.1 Gfo/Idh/MocA family oxidoreductase [Niallia circulans]QKH63240.1 Gfo/Idh/MocA family oxidoreductase [Niallia circulans]
MKIGTIGTGFIVDVFLSALREIEGARCMAMYSRKEETAKTLAEKYQIANIYTELEKLYADPNIDFIYVASPNSLHFEQSYQALLNGKHVICEKPFTSTVQETETLIKLAREKGLMLFEGITTIHLPNYQLIKKHLNQLGQLKFVQCNYSQYSSRYDALLKGETPNVFNPFFAGGALADINIYNLHFVLNLFGAPNAVTYTANKHSNGIDTSGIVVMQYADFIAECVGAKDTRSMNFVLMQGENGYLHVENGANGCQKVILYLKDKEITLNNQTTNNLLYYELLRFKEIFDTKSFDKCSKLLEHSYTVMRVYEKARKSADILFPADLV